MEDIGRRHSWNSALGTLIKKFQMISSSKILRLTFSYEIKALYFRIRNTLTLLHMKSTYTIFAIKFFVYLS